MMGAENYEPLLDGDDATREFILRVGAEKSLDYATIGDAIRSGMSAAEIEACPRDTLLTQFGNRRVVEPDEAVASDRKRGKRGGVQARERAAAAVKYPPVRMG